MMRANIVGVPTYILPQLLIRCIFVDFMESTVVFFLVLTNPPNAEHTPIRQLTLL
jgi:hypothetical protein